MIINHSFRFIFLHVPKNAGTSISNWLSSFTGWNDIELGGTHYGEQIQEIYGKRFKLHKHSTAGQVRAVVGGEIWRSYFKFAVVRCPLDRLVSAYHFYKEWDHPGVAPAKECSDLTEFLGSSYFSEDRRNCTRATGSQASFLDTGVAEPLDKICRFETLNDDMRAVAERLGIDSPALPHSNSSSRGSYEDYYTAETRALTQSIYFEDFQRFGYPLS
jgi:hypothetical protein